MDLERQHGILTKELGVFSLGGEKFARAVVKLLVGERAEAEGLAGRRDGIRGELVVMEDGGRHGVMDWRGMCGLEGRRGVGELRGGRGRDGGGALLAWGRRGR